MESHRRTTSPSCVVFAYDATREHTKHEFQLTINNARMRGDIISAGDTLLVLGVLHTINNPMGYQTKACTDSFAGTNARALEEEALKKLDLYESMLLPIAETIKKERVGLKVKITAGTPTKRVIVQEALSHKPSWIILERNLRNNLKFYVNHIPCKVAAIQDTQAVDVVKHFYTNPSSDSDFKSVYSIERTIYSTSNEQYLFDNEQSFVSGGDKPNSILQYDSLEMPILCAACGLRSSLYVKESMRFQFSEIQKATEDFSKENLLGEGGFGHVYKGQLKDGQLIAAKMRKEASTQGYSEFFSEVHVLSFARHRNIVMLLGYCCKENHNILVYEYICNRSLDWHLFDESANFLEWHTRHSLAMGIAKGLRFLHEECRGGPIIHRDLRPSNILITHDFVPMLADFGLAKWKSGGESFQTRILGTSGYLAPEYAEYGIVSVRTDVYAYGIVLFQLISGRRVLDDKKGQSQHILQWAEPLVESLALHDLVDPHLGDSFDTHELYLLARVAFLCVRRKPEMRPSMGEVVRLLEAKNNNNANELVQQFIPHYVK
ncbi:cold-responsive protein kinase 1-like [Dioscorea cayenensis subsp. rotundata]|uniref:Cold-responsive protein kinase 1-like n=1 Tax=Dioscorea cayennensis subsp. rotundata TaxID=55577 RepID=A0AB40B3S7_DIOCR|nr:cold-responsive protein kinase 1-like [Dioscorea cayenensis subsp. rotundata]